MSSWTPRLDGPAHPSVIPAVLQKNTTGTMDVTHMAWQEAWTSATVIHMAWQEAWTSATVINKILVYDFTTWQLGFDLIRLSWSLLHQLFTNTGLHEDNL